MTPLERQRLSQLSAHWRINGIPLEPYIETTLTQTSYHDALCEHWTRKGWVCSRRSRNSGKRLVWLTRRGTDMVVFHRL